MSKLNIIFALGIWVTILPFLGFPYSLETFLVSCSGLAIIGLSYFLCKKLKAGENNKKTFENFSENNNFSEEK